MPEKVDDAAPPPVAHDPPVQDAPTTAPTKDPEDLNQATSPGVHDRWAQIRKNAAQRAATRPREDHPPVASGKASEGEEDASGEEST